MTETRTKMAISLNVLQMDGKGCASARFPPMTLLVRLLIWFIIGRTALGSAGYTR